MEHTLSDVGTVIPLPSGKYCVVIDGYSYNQMRKSKNYYCAAKQSAACRARVKVDDDGNILDGDFNHTHPRPKKLNALKYIHDTKV